MSDQHFLETIKSSKIQDFIEDVRGYANELTIVIKTEHIFEALKLLKEKYAFNYLADITASDNYTDENRFELAYNLVSLGEKRRLRVACFLQEDNPETQSVIPLWGAADWYERECYDMMGIKFTDHPDLRRMFMPEDYEFFPLRKEFPLLGIPGSIPLPEKDPPKEYK